MRFLRRLPPTDQSEDIDGIAVLRAIESQHGLLIERARNIYSFSHLTFHEYFAARYIADYPEQRVLRAAVAQADNPQWREVLLLSTSMLDHRSAGLLFQIWDQQLQAQLRNNPALAEMLAWTSQQARLIAPADIELRATILTITLIDQAIKHNQEIAIPQKSPCHVMLSEAKHLCRPRHRPFASLRVTWGAMVTG